ncbi:MAG: hypothetical protein JWN77_451 [Frankiales bacterium]|nr:hypothetical protein [Frankiales bacterium]
MFKSSRFAAGLVVGAVIAVAMTGTAYAATGGTFLLGRNNAAGAQTALVNSGAGPVLALSTRSGQVPLAVSANSGKATNLNADKLDGLDSSLLQRRVTGTCPAGKAVTGVSATGDVTCASTTDRPLFVRFVELASGAAEAACPTGLIPVAGGVLPNLTSGLAAVVYTGPYTRDGVAGWLGGAAPMNASAYDGTGRVFVSCAATVDYPGSGSGVGLRRAEDVGAVLAQVRAANR